MGLNITFNKLTSKSKTNTACSHKWELNDENSWTHGGEQQTLGTVTGVGRGRALGLIAYRDLITRDGLIGAANKNGTRLPM